MQVATDCVISIDSAGIVLDFNESAQSTFGYTREEALGQNIAELIVPTVYRDEHRKGLERFVRTGEGRILGDRIRTRALRADGTEFPIELCILSVGNKEQPIFSSFIRDMTAEENAEEGLRQSQRTLMTLLSNLPGMAYRCRDGAYGNLEFISEGCTALTGYEAPELVEDSENRYNELIHIEDRERVRSEIQAALEAQETFQVMYRIRTKEGDEKWVHDRGRGIFSVFSESGEIISLEGFVTDITERKRAEELLSDYSQTLEAEVQERTDELKATHDQLMMQEKMASLGALTAGIAHEIKNPLNFVNNFARMSVELAQELREDLQNQSDNIEDKSFELIMELVKDLEENAARIQDHGMRADGIMKSMLMHSRSSKKEFRLTDINELLEEEITLAFHGLKAQDTTFNIAITKDLDPDHTPLSVISQDIGRVFLNVINNACFAAHQRKQEENGTFTPELRVQTRHDDNGITVRIRDNGRGMPEEVVTNVFDPFFTTKPAGEGTGLGLSIAYDIIVQDHGGSIDIDTKPGEFTEFIIRIPKKN